MPRPTDERILEFCLWQSTQPEVMTKAEWRAAADAAGFADIRDSDLPCAAAVLRALAACDAQHASVLEAALVARGVQLDEATPPVPQPIETAPKNGGWVLGLVLPEGPTETRWQPWMPVTWGDTGWYDDEGYGQEPTAWVPLPDPQPRPTGWTPPSGTIKVAEITGEGWTSNDKPLEVPWRWLISVEKPDGSYDQYRDTDMAVTREEAVTRATKLQAKIGLPIVIVPLDRKGIPFRPGATIQ
ncbi:hypothetical protein [Novosphingobium resinovorum]|uniref:hypothetical protein n=1 Tax=Novosphingobium resinovorum TaxID=158500 RepID=UPI002ED1F157|nr:hypothetical protein [Novosphingobium resinovorum]